jgi:hypothetical protein
MVSLIEYITFLDELSTDELIRRIKDRDLEIKSSNDKDFISDKTDSIIAYNRILQKRKVDLSLLDEEAFNIVKKYNFIVRLK